ncbi:hypothetical protein [Desulfovibrio sp. ZJ200]|uniref:hypothetical protein n=1 Tax=Desulfovibrio sp. ZJ200 TaxID=2709792 RepID=UPI0013EC5937|nr:hypothetical protein [Desulfovibrio sp. ZJ200]
MRYALVFSLMLWILPILFSPLPAQSLSAHEEQVPSAPPLRLGPDISAQYLEQARAYRAQGRYELARQSYAQALSTCQSSEALAVIKHELGGVELLLRTMR